MKKRKNKSKRRDRKHRRKAAKRLKQEEPSTAIQPDEAYDAGAFSIRRFGNVVEMKSNLSAEGLKDMRERMRKERPRLKEEIDHTIEKLCDMFRLHDPLELIVPLTLDRQLRTPETSGDSLDMKSQSDIDYLHSLITAQRLPSSTQPITTETVEEVERLLEALRLNLHWYYTCEGAEDTYTLEILSNVVDRVMIRRPVL